MAAPQVRIDHDEMAAVKSQAEAQRERVSQLLQRINDQLDTLKSDNWVGDNATQFYNVMESDVVPGVDRLVKAFTAMEDAVDQLNRIFEAGEDEAQACFPQS